MSKTEFIPGVECRSALRGEDLLTRAPLWMDFEDLRPRGLSQTQKTNIVRFRSCEVSGMVGVLETDAGQRRT